MKNIRLLIPYILGAALAACSTPAPVTPIAPKAAAPNIPPPTADWITQAQLIQTGDYKIRYEGTADGAYSADGKFWTGTLTGKVYVVGNIDLGTMIPYAPHNTTTTTLYTPNGTLTIRANGVHVSGPYTINITTDQTEAKRQ